MPFKLTLGTSLILLASLLAPWPSPCRAAAPGTLLELGDLELMPVKELNEQYKKKVKEDLGNGNEKFMQLSPMAVFQQMIQEHAAALVPSRRMRYASVDASGAERTYSGRIFLPSRKPTDPPREVPLVIYQHATETRRRYTAYYNKGDETMLGALAAELCGFAVAMPDGDGMGADPSPRKHASCYGKTTGTCLVDMIRAALGELNGRRVFDDVNYIWDGEVYIVGYSEGGYISMAAVKELATNPACSDIKLTGTACMGAPFDFAQATRSLLADPKAAYDRPYIPAYFVAAWQDIAPSLVSFDKAINPALLKKDASGSAAEWLGGVLGGDAITPLIQARLTGSKDKAVPARSILNEDWVKKNINDPNSALNKLFEANTLVGGWKPTAPVLLVHDPYDKTVRFSGTKAMFDDWTKQGLRPIGIVEMAVGGVGTGHVGGAMVAIPTAFIWIDAGMPRSINDMAKDKIRAAIIDNAPPGLEANADALATTLGVQEANENRALLPLSRIDPAGKSCTLSYGDRLFKVGKVKLYTIEKKPVFDKQPPSPGLGGYTRLVKEMKQLGDKYQLPADVPTYMAVYPEKGGVALTLKFTAGSSSYTANIKQLKNKIIGRNTPTAFDISSNFRSQVQTDNFDRAETGRTFITLPGK